MGAFRYIDVILMLVAAPILLLIGVPAVGFAVGAGVWLVLRVVEVGVKRYAVALGDVSKELIVSRLVFPLVRIFAIALTVIFLRRDATKDDALTALLLLVFVFTIHFGTSFAADRPRSS